MRMPSLLAPLSATLLVLLVCCGGGDDAKLGSGSSTSQGGEGGAIPGDPGCLEDAYKSPPNVDLCKSCLQTRCDADMRTAWGPGWDTVGLYGGACGATYSCWCTCTATDSACYSQCTITTECNVAIEAVNSCISSECAGPSCSETP